MNARALGSNEDEQLSETRHGVAGVFRLLLASYLGDSGSIVVTSTSCWRFGCDAAGRDVGSHRSP